MKSSKLLPDWERKMFDRFESEPRKVRLIRWLRNRKRLPEHEK